MKDFYMDSHKYAFCHVQISDSLDSVSLISFETNVLTIELDSETGFVSVSGVSNYSRSTIKHINWFTKEFIGYNLYGSYKAALVSAKRSNLDIARLTFTDILTETRVKKRIEHYISDGKAFKGYKTTPNYEYWFYNDNSNFTPIDLRH